MRHVEDMTPSESGPRKLREPKMRNGVQRGALARHTGQTALSVPDAVKSRDSITDHHHRELRVRRYVITSLSDQPRAVALGQPIDRTHFAGVHGAAGPDWQAIVDGENLCTHDVASCELGIGESFAQNARSCHELHGSNAFRTAS